MERIDDLEEFTQNRFKSIKDLENGIYEYFGIKTHLHNFEGEIDFIEDNHLVGVLANYDIDIWYILDNEKQLYITEVAWDENGETKNEDLEFYTELNDILDKYTDEVWQNEPLDADEVDKLVEILRKQLNLINGNITLNEYLKEE